MLILVYRRSYGSISALGCYQGGSSRAFKDAAISTGDLTLSVCATFCAQQGYAWFGAEFGRQVRQIYNKLRQCFCSATAPSLGKLDDSRCNMNCAADNGTICGGASAMSVYSIDGIPPTTAVTSATTVKSTTAVKSSSTASLRSSSIPKSTVSTQSPAPTATASLVLTPIGCFADSASNRLLSGVKQIVKTNTPAACAAWCGTQGYALSGVEYGTEVSHRRDEAHAVLLWRLVRCYTNDIGRSVQLPVPWRCFASMWRIRKHEPVSQFFSRRLIGSPVEDVSDLFLSLSLGICCHQTYLPRLLSRRHDPHIRWTDKERRPTYT